MNSVLWLGNLMCRERAREPRARTRSHDKSLATIGTQNMKSTLQTNCQHRMFFLKH